jgi:hypothetical protein
MSPVGERGGGNIVMLLILLAFKHLFLTAVGLNPTAILS